MNSNDLLAAVAVYVISEGEEQELAKARVRELLDGGTIPSVQKTETVEVAIKRMLLELGVPTHVKGYSHLICAIRIVAEDPTVARAITKELYPEVAKRFGDTSPWGVEWAIRHAVELVFERCDFRVIERYFGNTVSPKKGKLTNAEFITRLADVVRNGM